MTDSTTTAGSNQSPAQATLDGIGAAAVGVGMLIMVLFPFSIPFLALTAAFVLPLALIPLAAAIPVALVAGVVVGGVRATRAVRSRLGTRRPLPASRGSAAGAGVAGRGLARPSSGPAAGSPRPGRG